MATSYKLDMRMTAGVTACMQTHFAYAGPHSFDQAARYQDEQGNIYAQEVHPGGVNDHRGITCFSRK
jgi:hypothetical protein